MHTPPDSKTDPRAEAIRDTAMDYMGKALEMELRLDEDDSVYSLVYIGQKLAKCSSLMERLGEISMQLARVSLEVTRQTSLKKSLLQTKERQLKSDPTYVNLDRQEKSNWLSGKMEVCRLDYEDWDLTHQFLDEVRSAVNDRLQLFKRLDSDIRLQHKLLEAKILLGAESSLPGAKNSRGAQGSNGYGSKGNSALEELELD